MNEDPKRWINRWLRGQNLPALHKTVTDLDALYCEEDPFEQLSNIIHRDPAVTSQVFTYANSVQHHHFGMPVTTVEHAAMMLGLDRMKTLHGKLPVVDPATAEDNRKGLLKAYSRAYHSAMQATVWARLRVDMVPWEVFAATLLHELGEMAVWAFQPDKAQEIEDLVHGAGHQSRKAAQLHVLGFTYDALSIELAQIWKLPLLVHESLKHENSSRPRIKVILLALKVARLVERNWYSKAMTSCIEEAAALLHISYTEMVNRIHQTAVAAARAYQTHGVTPAAARLITLPTPQPRNETSTAPLSSPVKTKTAPRRQQRNCLKPQPQILDQVSQWFAGEHDKPLDLPSIMKQAVRGMHEGIGLSRVVFATSTPNRKGFKARLVRSCEESMEFSRFYMELQSPHLFTRLMAEPMSIWVNNENRGKLGEQLPSSLLRLLDTDSFFASSISIDSHHTGLFYCDCHLNQELLDEKRYQQFQQLCGYTADAIKQLSASQVCS